MLLHESHLRLFRNQHILVCKSILCMLAPLHSAQEHLGLGTKVLHCTEADPASWHASHILTRAHLYGLFHARLPELYYSL